MSTTIHIAGYPINVGGQLRQLCAWCGHRLIDVDLSCCASPAKEDGSPPDPYPCWEPNALVEYEETPGCVRTSVVEAVDGKLPPNCCAKRVALHSVKPVAEES